MATKEEETPAVEETKTETPEAPEIKEEEPPKALSANLKDLAVEMMKVINGGGVTTSRGLRAMVNDVKQYAKDAGKMEKEMHKKPKRSQSTKRKEPSGFARPTDISNELAIFLGVEPGLQLARTEVTKRITAHIKERNLQRESNKREIDLTKPGAEELKALLEPDATLTFFNLQRYLKKHFPKKVKPEDVKPEGSEETKVEDTEDTADTPETAPKKPTRPRTARQRKATATT
jgi:chromatin remodeling complex protein RSC6